MTNVINLVLSKDNVFIWNADDWLRLRRDHRITGELVGCHPKKPRQDLLLGLPLLLLPEEATLLQEKGIARIVKYPCLLGQPSDSLRKAFDAYREELYIQQAQCLKEERKNQVLAMMDRIIEGKKRKILGIDTSKRKMRRTMDPATQSALENVQIDTEELLKEEMAKLPKLDRNDAFVQNHTACPWLSEKDVEIAEWKYPSTPDQELRYKTYKDLWEQGYYITSADKFNGDFLVYPGDPIMFHSQFIVRCKNREEELSVIELVGQCRVGCNVRKTQVFAMFSEDGHDVRYQSFQWAESALEND